MADTKISALADIVTLAAGDKVPVADASDLTQSKSATMTEINTFIRTQTIASAEITGLGAASTLAVTDSFPLSQGGTAVEATVAQVIAAMRTLISGNSGTANQLAAPSETWQVLTADAASNSTTTIAVVMTTSSLPAGKYLYRYDIISQSAATTTAQKFNVNATGTVVRHLYHLFFPSAGVTAATGVADQDINVTTGAVWAHESTRTDGATLGPHTDVDTANADIHYVIEGVLETSTSGDLELGHASEVAAASTVQDGTTLRLWRLS
jgi:hypothetical protein